MVVGFIAYSISAYHTKGFEFESPSGDVYSIQHYVIKFNGYLREVGGTPVSPTNNNDLHDISAILLKVVFNTIALTLPLYR
jgi:hypothetical protein